MSTWIGSPDDRLSVREAQRALADSARLAARPSRIWLAGFAYPSVLVVPSLGILPGTSGWAEHEDRLALIVVPLLFPPLARLVVGLARLSAPRHWSDCLERHGRARLRDAWAAGQGLMWSTLGLWACVLMLDLAVLGLGLAVFRALGGDSADWRAYVFGGPLLLFCCAYATVVSVLFQLALQSLAQNRRGVASALRHAWKLAQNDPWSTVRAALVDCGLSVALAVVGFVVSTAGILTCCFYPVVVLAFVILTAIAGVTRALYWGRVYRALGGLTPEDGVPGLPQAG